MSTMIRNLKGTKDTLPGESRLWLETESIIHNFMSLHGYELIRTPMFEKTELFNRSIGEGTDIVVRAKNGLENVVELGYTTAEHHPYWGLLHNCSQISKTVLDKWDEDISKEELSEIQWMINELQNSCVKLQDKIDQ